MLTPLQRFVAAPVFEDDEDKTRVAAMLNAILLALVAIAAVFVIFSLLVFHDLVAPTIFVVLILMRWGALALIRRGYVRSVSISLLSILWVGLTFLALASGGVDSAHYLSYITVVLIAGLLLGGPAAMTFAGLSILTGWGMFYAESKGLLTQAPIPVTLFSTWATVSSNFVVGALLLGLATRSMHDALGRVRHHRRELAQKVVETQQLAQQAQEANEFRSRLIARVSHELRTPLGGILGLTETLHYEAFGPLSPEQQEVTQRVIHNTQHLDRLIIELLEQAQYESNQLHLHVTDFSPQEVVKQVETTFSALAQDKGLGLKMEIAEGLPNSILGDPNWIEQILTNLVGNAIKFTETGTIDVHIYQPNNDHWALSVADTGIGIPQEAHGYIFEPFRQVDETAARKYGGFGLGLSIVQQLTTAMNGQIKFESEVGQGSTFTVILPLNPATEGDVQ